MAISKTQQHSFTGRPEHAMVALEHTLRDLGMEIQGFDPYAGTVVWRTSMTFWSWGENMSARVRPTGPETVEVELTSGLKFGLVDWGKNRRNLEKVFTALRARMESGSYAWPVQEVPPAPEPGWHPDPTGRHHLRYWNGQVWTEHVNDQGTPGTDPLASPPVG